MAVFEPPESVAAFSAQVRKLRLFSFWEEVEELGSPWLKRAWQRTNSRMRTKSDMENFKSELERSGVRRPGITLCNCEMSGGNDIYLKYPWIHMSGDSYDVTRWIKQKEDSTKEALLSPTLRRYFSQEISTTSSSHIQFDPTRKLIQGTYKIVETLVPSREILKSGEELAVILGFRTTDDNCVDSPYANEERNEEARSWRDWTGIGTLYTALARLSQVEITKIEFLESHLPNHTAVFHYLIILFLQVEEEAGRLTVLDTVARFRVRQMSGYVTLYTCVGPLPPTIVDPIATTDTVGVCLDTDPAKEAVLRKVAEGRENLEQARREFLSN